ncbi:MAG: hypothetical protein K6G16_07545 [Lachnospiraceae bacterium]|nr:hypothetical protein [Lachnospiraceae bacterium]
MIRRVMILQKGNSDHDMLNAWLNRWGEEFKRLETGVQCFSATGETDAFIRQILDAADQSGFDAVLALNSDGLQMLSADGKNLWDRLGIPYFDYLVDHPLEHTCIDCPCNDYHVICVDENHAGFVRRFYPNVKSADFLPLSGFGNTETEPDSRESFFSREYDLVLTAGLVRPEIFLDRLMSLPERMRAIALSWIEHMESHPDLPPEDSLRSVLRDLWGGQEIEDALFLKVADACTDALMYMRSFVRQQVVEALLAAGTPIHIWGNGWEELRARYPHSRAVFHGDAAMTETPDIYRRTKLALSILPLFKGGTHDRIATAQIGGAAVLTDGNAYLSDLYGESRGIFLYEIGKTKEIPERVSQILNDREELFATAQRGQELAVSTFSAEITAQKLLAIMEAAKKEEG